MKEKDHDITLEEEVSDEKDNVDDNTIPEWAQLLEPVRKLPTNVGTRIRRCVNEALGKGPPEWAKKRLEHSISKEVYKGNASGPTKKAVLSVLADVMSGEFSQKSENKRNKKKIVIPVSDLIMKYCRIVLRRAAAADDAKAFCTLLGRSLLNSCENDDEGLLGSPAMVSRPLDFRTIDLRLAVGAYGGSHDSFLEDARELWNNLRSAFGDQPDLAELAETLSQNFESLYEKEVLTLIQKLEHYSKLDSLNAETKKEIDDLLAFADKIPKAPWDEGVCKVCGVDRDDNSVLLCDTCDAEYHTYCLNPPLARIPEGNWYCPSCVVGKHMVQDASAITHAIFQSCSKKYQGEVTRVYLEALSHLALTLEGKEYWQFSLKEKINLLKFLSDELLNSTLIRQHLEQSAEATAELQQKLRSLSTEWKNLKAKEEFLSLRAAKVDACAVGEIGVKEGIVSAPLTHDESQDGTRIDGFDKLPSVSCPEKIHSSHNQATSLVDSGDKVNDLGAVADDSSIPCESKDKSFVPHQLTPSNQSSELIAGAIERQPQDNSEVSVKNDCTVVPPTTHQGVCPPSDMNADITQHVPPAAMNETQAHHLELNTVKNDILHLQNSVMNLEAQILKLSLRREFLGSDSRGHLYWASFTATGCPQIIVDRSLTLQCGKTLNCRDLLDNDSALCNPAPSCISTCFEGSQACFPFVYKPNNDAAMSSSWVSYDTDLEIEELTACLKDSNQKEKELKESISQWRKLKFQENKQSRDLVLEECQEASSLMTKNGKTLFSNCFITKASVFLEKKYGLFDGLEAADVSKKQGKKARVIEEKMHRCDCLEFISPSGFHCPSCHQTFCSDIEFMGHNDGNCSLVPPGNKSKDMDDGSLKANGNMKSVTAGEEFIQVDMVESSKSVLSEMTSRVKYHNAGIACPYDLGEISAKFATKNSNKELIKEIGLIGSNGIPSLVMSISPYIDDTTLMLIPSQKERSALGDGFNADERKIFSEGNSEETKSGHQSIHDNSSTKASANEVSKELEPNSPNLGCLIPKDSKHSPNKDFPGKESGHCCVVPQAALMPLAGQSSHILKRLKIDLLDMEAALPETALKQSKAQLERRWAWRTHVKASKSIYEMVQATIVLEEMIKTEYLRNEWWYWSSLSAAAKTSTVASLALRIHSLDAAIIYEKATSSSDPTELLEPSRMSEQKHLPGMDSVDKGKGSRKSNRKRKEPEG